MIVSAIPGRIRVRPITAAAARSLGRTLAERPGVRDSVHNPRTRSLLVRYDSTVLTPIQMETLIEGAASPSAGPTGSPRRRAATMRRVKRGMLLTLGASLLLGAADRKTPHIAGGVAFVALLGYHLYVYRKRLLA